MTKPPQEMVTTATHCCTTKGTTGGSTGSVLFRGATTRGSTGSLLFRGAGLRSCMMWGRPRAGTAWVTRTRCELTVTHENRSTASGRMRTKSDANAATRQPATKPLCVRHFLVVSNSPCNLTTPPSEK